MSNQSIDLMSSELYLEYRSRAAKLIFDVMESQQNLIQTDKVVVFSKKGGKAHLLDPEELESFNISKNDICFDIRASHVSILKFTLRK